jgi:hypothetical protein
MDKPTPITIDIQTLINLHNYFRNIPGPNPKISAIIAHLEDLLSNNILDIRTQKVL